MKAVVRKIGAKEVLDSLYVHSKRCREEVCFIPKSHSVARPTDTSEEFCYTG